MVAPPPVAPVLVTAESTTPSRWRAWRWISGQRSAAMIPSHPHPGADAKIGPAWVVTEKTLPEQAKIVVSRKAGFSLIGDFPKVVSGSDVASLRRQRGTWGEKEVPGDCSSQGPHPHHGQGEASKDSGFVAAEDGRRSSTPLYRLVPAPDRWDQWRRSARCAPPLQGRGCRGSSQGRSPKRPHWLPGALTCKTG